MDRRVVAADRAGTRFNTVSTLDDVAVHVEVAPDVGPSQTQLTGRPQHVAEGVG